jgi:diguanylate cyclase (GGDEF)-like protein
LRDRGLGEPSDGSLHNSQDGGARALPDGRIVLVSRQDIVGEGWVATYDDVTERRLFEDRLAHMARHDALTGLPNRMMLLEDMERTLPLVRRGGHLAVLGLDLDHFKSVNDMLGHAAGDELLCQVTERLLDKTRKTDLVARFGGDEFAIVQMGVEQPAAATVLADRLVESLREPFNIKGHRVEIGTSIGVALTDETAYTTESLLRDADIALYRAKAAGRDTWRFFRPEMNTEIQQLRHLEADLRRALAEEQFEIYYQPLVEARTQSLLGFEALLRWHHPERGMVPPTEFIPVAEKMGLIKAIGAWVLRKACADAVKWPENIKISVNLSSVQFVNGVLVREVEQALIATGLPANRLELEITESVLVHVSMDDFGTGYSSLSYLRRFPFDKIKIDQSFVGTLGQEKSSIEIIRAVIGLGKALGMDVLAEGVETAEQLGILESEGCGQMQGYLFNKPRPVQDVQGIIAADLTAKAKWPLGPTLVTNDLATTKPAA